MGRGDVVKPVLRSNVELDEQVAISGEDEKDI